jgi:hypothetical protein
VNSAGLLPCFFIMITLLIGFYFLTGFAIALWSGERSFLGVVCLMVFWPVLLVVGCFCKWAIGRDLERYAVVLLLAVGALFFGCSCSKFEERGISIEFGARLEDGKAWVGAGFKKSEKKAEEAQLSDSDWEVVESAARDGFPAVDSGK